MNLPESHKLIDLEGGYFVVHFFYQEDYFHVLEGDPWIILGQHLILTKWRANFRPSLQKFSTTLIWVRFRELSLEESLVDMEELVARIAKIGPISVDAYRGWYACVCVEVDLNNPLILS